MASMNRKPNVTTETAAGIAKDVYGLRDIEEVKELQSFYDCNFLIATPQKYYVLKVLNHHDSQYKEQLEAESKAMEFLRSQKFPCPEIYTTIKAKQNMAVVDLYNLDNTQEFCAVRLIEFREGTMAASIDRNPVLLYTIGSFVGSLSKTLMAFSHEGLTAKKVQHFKWEILEFLNLELYIHCFTEENSEEESVTRQVHKAFVENVKPHLQDFRYGTVHNDLNGENVLVTGPPYEVSAVLDFGDIIQSLVISELSNAMAFYMEGDRGLEFSGYLLSGYQSVFPLPTRERDLLYYFIAARLCQLVMYSKTNLVLNHSLVVEACYRKYWSILREFWKTTKDQVERVWRKCVI